jgi:hypothetical protein
MSAYHQGLVPSQVAFWHLAQEAWRGSSGNERDGGMDRRWSIWILRCQRGDDLIVY